MQLIKSSNRLKPRVSLILLDWSVRESFHLLHYLSKQDIQRDIFEVIIVEYYNRISANIITFDEQVDTWLLLEMPDNCYYHKHLMYNAGIVAAKGDICVICDSDAMVREGFIRSIIQTFDENPGIVLHMDQFRNSNKDLYPFCYPDFSAVTGHGCINVIDGKTRGIVEDGDAIHTRNYGACMCALRSDLIAIGGSDEHIDFLGHICGPYDMTFRLVNLGCREVWHQTEFLYHTWHPGQAGEENYLGPHDGRHISTTALDALVTGRTMPLVENESIRNLRLSIYPFQKNDFRIDPKYMLDWSKEKLRIGKVWVKKKVPRKLVFGYVILRSASGFAAYPRFLEYAQLSHYKERMKIVADTEEAVLFQIKQSIPLRLRILYLPVAVITYLSNAIVFLGIYVQNRARKMFKK